MKERSEDTQRMVLWLALLYFCCFLQAGLRKVHLNAIKLAYCIYWKGSQFECMCLILVKLALILIITNYCCTMGLHSRDWGCPVWHSFRSNALYANMAGGNIKIFADSESGLIVPETILRLLKWKAPLKNVSALLLTFCSRTFFISETHGTQICKITSKIGFTICIIVLWCLTKI